jgi:hypothetical protein
MRRILAGGGAGSTGWAACRLPNGSLLALDLLQGTATGVVQVVLQHPVDALPVAHQVDTGDEAARRMRHGDAEGLAAQVSAGPATRRPRPNDRGVDVQADRVALSS